MHDCGQRRQALLSTICGANICRISPSLQQQQGYLKLLALHSPAGRHTPQLEDTEAIGGFTYTAGIVMADQYR